MVGRLAPMLVVSTCLVHIDAVTASESFEVAVIKPSAPATASVIAGRGVFVGPVPGDRWIAQNITLASIIQAVYGLFPEQLIGAPTWAETARFDIIAKAAEPRPFSEINAMARNLLADRFQLKFHIEQRRLDVYALVLASPGGSLGKGLQQRTDCVADDPRTRLPLSGALTKDLPCGRVTNDVLGGVTQLRMAGLPVLSVLSFSGIRGRLERPVVDRTGLTGVFDIALDYGRQGSEFGQDAMTAIKDQLGVQLERRREESIDVTVIDRVEMPQFD